MGILRTDKISGLETPTSNDFGPNLLYNGDFSKGTDGWTGATGGTISVSNGQLTVTNTGVNGRAISTAFDTVVGELYEINIHNVSTTGQFRLELREADGYGSSNNFDSSNSVAGVRTLRFVATETSHTVVVYAIGGAGTTSTYDDITVRKINKLVIGSVHFDSVDDYIEVSGGLDIQSTNDYTIEAWIFPETINNSSEAFVALGSVVQANTFQIAVDNSDGNRIKFSFKSNSAMYANCSVGVWQHIAATRENGVIRLFVNGVQGATTTQSTPNALDNNGKIYIGRNRSNSKKFHGYVSNVRITKSALYTANFTPPTHELEVIGDTVLLCCNNPDSVTAEATGRTITVNGNPNFVTKNPGLSRDFTSGTEFRGVTTFDTQGYFVPPSGTTEQRGAGRAIFAGGYLSPQGPNATIESVNINSLGNATKFGTLKSNTAPTSTSSATRQLVAGGYVAPLPIDNIDFITIATSSDSVDFGTLGTIRRDFTGLSNNTRSVFGGGTTTGSTVPTSNMEYVTSASLGSATPFGSLTVASRGNASCASPTRGIFFGGYQAFATPVSTYTNTIDYITIATTGSATDFGDLAVDNNGKKGGLAAFSNSTRGVVGGGAIYGPDAPAYTTYDTIEYVTIATTGNAQDFGNLTSSNNYLSGTSNSVRGIFNQGTNPTYTNTIQYVTIASTGNAQDFGDAINKFFTYNNSGSDSHGGLS